MYLFALMGVYVVIDSMLKTKVDAMLKRLQIPFKVSVTLLIVVLASFLISSSINGNFYVMLLTTFAFSLALFFSILEWNNKRKTKQLPSQKSSQVDVFHPWVNPLIYR